ncbi:MAG: RIP metalloprotease RseP [Bacteroidetes bacterium]|nr:RIP metalloprotease RseP [Rhodothermia bacterium]MCX7906253.1 RIP metalloprotease RseP [Bacteroidota bacterium]MDW8285717.1 RIP metalloprotease RseP [Bacteroidota bacterium]
MSYVLYLLLAIFILVLVHELGHFLTAKLFRMRVERFSIGFPPRLFGVKIGETDYCISALPFGGYVKIAGMIDESLDASTAGRPPEPWEFRAKPLWQRFVVIVAGVSFNVLLAWAIFSAFKYYMGERYIPAQNVRAIYVAPGSIAHEMGLRTGDRLIAVNGRPLERALLDNQLIEMLTRSRVTFTVVRAERDTLTFEAPPQFLSRLSREPLGIDILPPLVGGLEPGGPAARAGLQVGDRITEVAGRPVRFFAELRELVSAHRGKPILLRWERQGRFYEAVLTPREQDGRIGIAGPTSAQLERYFGVVSVRYDLGGAIWAGAQQTVASLRGIIQGFGRILTGQESLRESIGGPIQIARITRDAAVQGGATGFWYIVALLSLTLAFINILPIPALDGGHVVFLLYEAIARREPSVRVRLVTQQIGMALLLGLMIFVVFNDLSKLF